MPSWIVCGSAVSSEPGAVRRSRSTMPRAIARVCTSCTGDVGAMRCSNSGSSISTTRSKSARFIAQPLSIRRPVAGSSCVAMCQRGMRALTIATLNIACVTGAKSMPAFSPSVTRPESSGGEVCANATCGRQRPSKRRGTCDRLQRMLRANPALTRSRTPGPMNGVTMPTPPITARCQPAAGPSASTWKTSTPPSRRGCSKIQRSTASMRPAFPGR